MPAALCQPGVGSQGHGAVNELQASAAQKPRDCPLTTFSTNPASADSSQRTLELGLVCSLPWMGYQLHLLTAAVIRTGPSVCTAWTGVYSLSSQCTMASLCGQCQSPVKHCSYAGWPCWDGIIYLSFDPSLDPSPFLPSCMYMLQHLRQLACLNSEINNLVPTPSPPSLPPLPVLPPHCPSRQVTAPQSMA